MRPNLRRPERASPADLAECREMIRAGSRSFHAASLLLPEMTRAGAYAIYGFCRCSDDSVDLDGGGLEAVAALSRRLDAIYAGAPEDRAVDRALAEAVETFCLPRAPFDALLEGLAFDAQGGRCETFSDLLAYAARVAGSVGAMMAALMDARSPALVARALDLGVAMQLTNVARDVGEDARAGRLYLPLAWLREAGVDPERLLARPRFTPALGAVIARVLAEADRLYARADAGVGGLAPSFRPAIAAARLLYAEIGRELARRGCDSVSLRSVVPMTRKLALLARANARPPASPADLDAPAIEEARFLIGPVVASAPANDASSTHAPGLAGGVRWALELLAALDERPRRVA